MKNCILFTAAFMRVILVILSFFLFSTSAQPYRVAIIPFTINAEEDLTPIKDGIYDLLSSRLSQKDTIDIINREETEKSLTYVEMISGESRALLVGAKLKANYVVYGSLIITGQNISILMKVVDVSGGSPSLTYTEHITEIDKVIPQINLWATDINKQGLYNQMKTAEDTMQLQPVQSTPASEERETKTDTSTPSYKKVIPESEDSKDSLPYQNVFSKDFWRGPTYSILINGIALGDVDNDGAVETIIVTPKRVMMYRCTDREFIKIKDIKKISTSYPVSVDVADINGNGTPEIFITTLDVTKTRANSFVLEYDGTQFKTISRNIRYYLRAIRLNDTTHVLLGQTGSRAFSGKVFEMKWNQKKYSATTQILPSRSINVLGLAYGDIMNKKKNIVVAYDGFDNIRVFNPAGKKIWSTHEAYGGSTLSFNISKNDGVASTSNVDYLPMRLLMQDINKDGVVEVVAVKNHGLARNLLGNIRKYKKSHLEIFAWDGFGLASQWTSGTISNYIRDFAIGDFDNDGKDEFVAALVLKQGKSVFVKPVSSIIAYEMK